MKNSIFLIALIMILFSCTEDKKINESDEHIVLNQINDEILSEWQLTAQLLDPGDGSGVFTPITSDRTLTFYDNLEVISKGSFCSFDPNDEAEHTAIYDQITGTIKTDCGNGDFIIGYKMEGDEMILDYHCIEPCLLKYTKI